MGDSETVVQDKLNVLQLFLTSGLKSLQFNSTDINTTVSPLKLDEWSSQADIEVSRKVAIDSIKDKVHNVVDMLSNDENDHRMDQDDDISEREDDLISKLDEHLLSHASFTLALLERLCFYISEVGSFERMVSLLAYIHEVMTVLFFSPSSILTRLLK